MFDLTTFQNEAAHAGQAVREWLVSPLFYAQVAASLIAWALAMIASALILSALARWRTGAQDGMMWRFRERAADSGDLLRPLLTIFFLGVAIAVCDAQLGVSWLVKLAQSVALIVLLSALINRFFRHPLINAMGRWLLLPVAALYVFGWMPPVISYLDQTAFAAGNVRVSALSVVKAGLFGFLLFWLSRAASTAGQRVIRQQDSIDPQTREIAAKGFDLAVIAIAGLLLMNLLGVDLSILAVFSGAIGVGLGFGLQQIASNFISGIIMLLERRLKLGDFVEIEDGAAGVLTALNMRASTLDTGDGKTIDVPNAKFITGKVTNWTHHYPRQRYETHFVVGFGEDLHHVAAVVESAVAKVDGILRAPFAPVCALTSLNGMGAQFALRFWVNGLDDGGKTSHVLFAIWQALGEAQIPLTGAPGAVAQIPMPVARKKNGEKS